MGASARCRRAGRCATRDDGLVCMFQNSPQRPHQHSALRPRRARRRLSQRAPRLRTLRPVSPPPPPSHNSLRLAHRPKRQPQQQVQVTLLHPSLGPPNNSRVSFEHSPSRSASLSHLNSRYASSDCPANFSLPHLALTLQRYLHDVEHIEHNVTSGVALPSIALPCVARSGGDGRRNRPTPTRRVVSGVDCIGCICEMSSGRPLCDA